MNRNYMNWKIIWVEIIWVEIIWNAIIWVELYEMLLSLLLETVLQYIKCNIYQKLLDITVMFKTIIF